MPLARLEIKNFKSIKECDISFSELNVFIGENGTGKTNLLDAVDYFYKNLTGKAENTQIFDENNPYSNEVRIALIYDLSEFVKISKSNSGDVFGIIGDDPDEDIKYSGYYKAIIAMASKSKEKRVRVELSQIKGKQIKWNCSYEERLIFKSLFPIFLVDTRNLDVTEWGYVWDILGELSKVSNVERKEIEAKINGLLLKESKEISNKIKGVVDIFNAANVSVKPAASKEFAKNLSKVFFSGDAIQQGGKRLGYYSTGTNSVKYIELLLKAIDEISKTKLKEPIVLFDEPEISLHTYFLDELADAMIDTSSKLCIMVSTHSSRLTKNIISKNHAVSLFSVKILDGYSHIQKMKKFSQYSPSSKYRVTDDHINSYFSRAILFVEGETELELFANPYIALLFPKLKDVDVFKAMSDKPILNIMNPRLNRLKTPYMCLIDMDKTLEFIKDKCRFRLKDENDYFKNANKEKLRYRSKKEIKPYLYHQHQRIAAMVDGLRVHYYLPFFSCDDPNYHELVSAVHEYLLSYNTFTFCTTVEGALINKYSLDYALDYLQKKKPYTFGEFKSYWETLGSTDKVNALRIVYNGNSDLLPKKTVLKNLPEKDKAVIEKNMVGSKTSGWVSDYLDGFFQSVSQIEGTLTVKAFKKCLENEQQQRNIEREFGRSFPELYSLIERLCDIMR